MTEVNEILNSSEAFTMMKEILDRAIAENGDVVMMFTPHDKDADVGILRHTGEQNLWHFAHQFFVTLANDDFTFFCKLVSGVMNNAQQTSEKETTT